jgi:Tol biopolymer transport system component
MGHAEGDRKPTPILDTTFNEESAVFSPDARWIAYQSDKSGQREIYLQAFPAGRSVPISIGGGVAARWRGDGQELYYRTLTNHLMAVPVRLSSGRDEVDVGTPVPLLQLQLQGNTINETQYTASRDGKRFLVNTLKEVTLPITLILNWQPKR